MNTMLVKRLILKDWYFHRATILSYLGIGAIALYFTANGGEGAFFAGSVLLLTVLIALGIHLTMATVVEERTQQTLPFVMSLPISVREYTTAKILANVLIFLVPWSVLMLGCVGVIRGRAAVQDGMIPFVVILLTEIFLSYCAILAIALVSESQGWAIGAIVVSNLSFQGFLYWLSHLPAIARDMKGASVSWSPTAVSLLVAELAAIVGLLALTYLLQARKRDFI